MGTQVDISLKFEVLVLKEPFEIKGVILKKWKDLHISFPTTFVEAAFDK